MILVKPPICTARKVYRTRDEARADVFDYIERFYNPRRRHSKLGYLKRHVRDDSTSGNRHDPDG